MQIVELTALTAQCIHAVKLALEGLLTAGLLTFVWMSAPYWRGRR